MLRASASGSKQMEDIHLHYWMSLNHELAFGIQHKTMVERLSLDIIHIILEGPFLDTNLCTIFLIEVELTNTMVPTLYWRDGIQVGLPSIFLLLYGHPDFIIVRTPYIL